MKQKLKTQQKKQQILKKKLKPLVETQLWQEKNQRKTGRFTDIIQKEVNNG